MVGCATQNPVLDSTKADQTQDSSKPQTDVVTCSDGSIQSPQNCPVINPIAKICPDGRAISWPFDCRSAEEIRSQNGQQACAAQDMNFDPKADRCIP